MTNETLIRGVGLSKGYVMPHGTVQVLQDLSIEIQRGESLCIMGPSGSGKSTLLHLLAGLDVPDSGEVLIQDDPLHTWGESKRAAFRARNIGIVFQYYHLLPDLTVLENALMPLRALSGYSIRSAQKDEVIERLTALGLGDRLTHRPVELSGGEQQRLAVARALVNHPEILMADEPTGNLDVSTGDRLLDDLFAISKEQSRTLVIVSHDARLAERCDRKVFIDGGRIRDPDEAALPDHP
jgi:putative ABC transport system ATP-binding protein